MSLNLLNLSQVRPVAEQEAQCLPLSPRGLVCFFTDEFLPSSGQPKAAAIPWVGDGGLWCCSQSVRQIYLLQLISEFVAQGNLAL